MGNLGKMEDMVVRYAGISWRAIPDKPKCCMVIACADHGVYKQGVSRLSAVDDGRHARSPMSLPRAHRPMRWLIMQVLTWSSSMWASIMT